MLIYIYIYVIDMFSILHQGDFKPRWKSPSSLRTNKCDGMMGPSPVILVNITIEQHILEICVFFEKNIWNV